jgi:hypothetical protein
LGAAGAGTTVEAHRYAGPSMTDVAEILHQARKLSFIREHGGQNHGVWVGTVLKLTGNLPGDSWCAAWVSLVLGIGFEGKSPLPRTASCDVLLEHARSMGWLTETPSVGDLYLYLRDPHDAHHVGILTGISPITGIAGNTSRDGTSSNGDGVYEHPLDPAHLVPGKIIYIHYPLQAD